MKHLYLFLALLATSLLGSFKIGKNQFGGEVDVNTTQVEISFSAQALRGFKVL